MKELLVKKLRRQSQSDCGTESRLMGFQQDQAMSWHRDALPQAYSQPSRLHQARV